MISIGTLSASGKVTLAELARAAGPGPLPEVALRARGTSMLPSLREGDLVTLASAAIIMPGDIVVFRREGQLVCHRVVAFLGDGSALTRGDNAGGPDAPVARADILGKVERSRRGRMPADVFRKTALWALRRLRALPGGERLLSWVLPRLCRPFVAVPAGLRCFDAYVFYRPGEAPPAGLGESDPRLLVLRLFGWTVARLELGSGCVEVSEPVAGLGLESRLAALAAEETHGTLAGKSP